MDQNTIQHKTPFNTSLWTGQNGQEGVVLVRESDGEVICLLDLFRYETGGGGGLLVSINLKDKYQFGYFSIFKIFIPFSDSYKLLHLSILSNTQRSSYKQWLMQQISYFANKENHSKESKFWHINTILRHIMCTLCPSMKCMLFLTGFRFYLISVCLMMKFYELYLRNTPINYLNCSDLHVSVSNILTNAAAPPGTTDFM